jgi:hypothetical protein
MADLLASVPSILLASVMTAGCSLIPLFFGMRKKSTATAITSSVIIGMLLNAMVSNGNGSVSMFQFVIVPAVLCVFGLGIAYVSYHKIDKIDV